MENKHGFGRIPSKFDARDYNLKEFIPKKKLLQMTNEKKWDFWGESLDQKDTPHCVGFSMANFGINLPVHTPYVNSDGHSFYYKCKEVDGQPNEENGSKIRSAGKVLREIGKISHYAFAPDIASIKWWVLNKSPMIVGTIWTEGMTQPDENNIIHVTGDIIGGHAYLINEWRSDGYIGIQNSWGKNWGENGKAYISVSDFEKLFRYDGEALTAVELESTIKNSNCILKDIINKIIKD